MLLEVESLRTYFDTEEGVVKAVDGVSFSLEPGKTLGIVGESGCGKSVTALSILRLLPTPPARVESGTIRFDGKSLLELSAEQLCRIRGEDIGMIFQEPMTSLNPVFTIGFQIGEALQIHRPDWSVDKITERTFDLLEMVGIADPKRRVECYPHELSGGQRQRVMIAMALSCEPKLLIADEPTTALDVTIQAQILELIKKLQHELGMAVLLITHDLGVVAEMVDTVMVMYAGKVVEIADVKTLYQKPFHPYTQGLLGSIPSRQKTGISGEERRLHAIPGQVPSPRQLPNGCYFQDRCPFVQPNCQEQFPELLAYEKDHLASCFEIGKKDGPA